MGVKGGWDLLRPVESGVSLIDWLAKMISTGMVHDLGPRIGVDASGWMFAAKYHHGQTKNPAQALLFNPHRPVYKCKKKVDKMVDWLAADFKCLLDGFGFSYWDAPGKAEAELAMLSRAGRIDAMMSEDFDAMVFGAQQVIRIKEESESEYIIDVYEQGPQLFSSDLVIITLLAGGDYDDGLQGCGTQTAVDVALTGTGKRLFEAIETSSAEDYPAIAAAWRQELCDLLHSKGAGHLSSHHHALASRVPFEFPKISVLVQYVQPLTSHSNFPASPSATPPDISMLAALCQELFIWGHSMGIIQNFSHHVFPGLAVRELFQDLCKRRGLIKDHDNHLSPHGVIAGVRSVHANQCERSKSEVYVTLAIPDVVLAHITSKKNEAPAWLSCALLLHSRPDVLDVKKDLQSAGPKRCRAVETSMKNTDSLETNVKHSRASSIIDISSDDEDEIENMNDEKKKRQRHELSLTYHIKVHHSVDGDIFELCTDDEGSQLSTSTPTCTTLLSETMDNYNAVMHAKDICQVLNPTHIDFPASGAVADDIEAEQEACPDSYDYDGDGDVHMDESGSSEETDKVLQRIKEASKGVKDSTHDEYLRLMKKFNHFLVKERYMQAGTDIFTQKEHKPVIDYYIVGFIMSHCDAVDMHGVSKPLDDPQQTYSHAQKLRASLMYGFWKKGGRGIQPWDRDTLSGNPSVSETMSSYMLGLHKRKI
ncbi:uncharacterized protein ARMOST_20003 [Armillaria ostoyae]|uniref:XPG-I domain-containing protein n=1 Tax=Armillaria ostoyae TaxID=47428 RepID=A0A284S647_ARMOS|nr:uncharacterized protein ARMOST_20003 [Armillaria ostoyae]